LVIEMAEYLPDLASDRPIKARVFFSGICATRCWSVLPLRAALARVVETRVDRYPFRGVLATCCRKEPARHDGKRG
jgi:hypothetical protein